MSGGGMLRPRWLALLLLLPLSLRSAPPRPRDAAYSTRDVHILPHAPPYNATDVDFFRVALFHIFFDQPLFARRRTPPYAVAPAVAQPFGNLSPGALDGTALLRCPGRVFPSFNGSSHDNGNVHAQRRGQGGRLPARLLPLPQPRNLGWDWLRVVEEGAGTDDASTNCYAAALLTRHRRRGEAEVVLLDEGELQRCHLELLGERQGAGEGNNRGDEDREAPLLITNHYGDIVSGVLPVSFKMAGGNDHLSYDILRQHTPSVPAAAFSSSFYAHHMAPTTNGTATMGGNNTAPTHGTVTTITTDRGRDTWAELYERRHGNNRTDAAMQSLLAVEATVKVGACEHSVVQS